MKREMLRERVELLEIGEAMGYPRMGYGRKDAKRLAIPPGQAAWEKFCGGAHSTRIPPALRVAKTLRDNGVTPWHPLSAAEQGRAEKRKADFLDVDIETGALYGA